MTQTLQERDTNLMLRRHHDFWTKAPVHSPLISFTVGAGPNLWSPWLANRGAQRMMGHGLIEAEAIDVASFIEDEKRYLEMADQVGDDVWRSALPFASIPWMEAIIGCPVERSEI